MTSNTTLSVIILAAGRGTRMRSAQPKLLHKTAGRRLIDWVIGNSQAVGADQIVVVQPPDRFLEPELPKGILSAVQDVPKHGDGTAGAAAAGLEAIAADGQVLILTGDAPLVGPEVLASLLAAHKQANVAATVLSAVLSDPGQLGRIVRTSEGNFEKIVETKAAGDATAEQLLINEVNAGVYLFDTQMLSQVLPKIGNQNAQGERYLPDALALLQEAGHDVGVHKADDPNVVLGVNDRADLATVETVAQAKIQNALMAAGVTIVSPSSTHIDADVQIASDVTIEPGTVLKGKTVIGKGSTVGPNTVIINSTVGERSTVVQSHLNEAAVADEVAVGPFAYLRPGADLKNRSKAGTFVEIKNSQVGEGSKVPHLSYIGDAQIGDDVNLGAATITANYDGFHKHKTVIGSGARTGVDTTLVAPVELGEGSFTGAGSVITKNVPDRGLGIARERQKNLNGYADQASAQAKQNQN